jgi:D-serine deaminase-like pyridoxal phosphate-dependent protein
MVRSREVRIRESTVFIYNDNIAGEEFSTAAAAVFDWADVITRVLSSRPEKELSLKKLGKKVVTEYQTVKQDHRTYDQLMAKFNKKVNKIKGVRVLRDKAKLVE